MSALAGDRARSARVQATRRTAAAAAFTLQDPARRMRTTPSVLATGRRIWRAIDIIDKQEIDPAAFKVRDASGATATRTPACPLSASGEGGQ